jgi:hypothetical protein
MPAADRKELLLMKLPPERTLGVALSLALLGGSMAVASPRGTCGPGTPGAERAPTLMVAEQQVDTDVATLAEPSTDDQPSEIVRARAKATLGEIRRLHFGNVPSVESRQIGVGKLAQFTEPRTFSLLIKELSEERPDIRGALAQHFASLKTDQADAALAAIAVFDRNDKVRALATDLLNTRIVQAWHAQERDPRDPIRPSRMIQEVMAKGLESRSIAAVETSAAIADRFGVHEALPLMIHALNRQAGGGGGGGGGGGVLPARGQIWIVTQTAFVSDLTPVVADGSVGFDPTMSVVSYGAVLRVLDAVVTISRPQISTSLVSLSSGAWGGQDTSYLGQDAMSWAKWYAYDFMPYREKLDAQIAEQRRLEDEFARDKTPEYAMPARDEATVRTAPAPVAPMSAPPTPGTPGTPEKPAGPAIRLAPGQRVY